VADPRPRGRGCLVALVMAHGRRARGKQRQIDAARTFLPELMRFDALANLVVAHRGERGDGQRWITEARELRLAKLHVGARGGRVVTVAIDDHEALHTCDGT